VCSRLSNQEIFFQVPGDMMNQTATAASGPEKEIKLTGIELKL
jgi:hypothetical protein